MDTLEKTELLSALQQILLDNTAGLSEYELINQLKKQQQALFINADLSDVLSLFRTHFVLFHMLYSMRDMLRSAGLFDLLISPLKICLQPAARQFNAEDQALERNDSLREYYLDLNNLSQTDRTDVEQLLYSSLNSLVPTPQVTAALAELDIEEPLRSLSAKDLRNHYRQLVSRHHPDRGGSTERLQRINQAMDTLRAHQVISR